IRKVAPMVPDADAFISELPEDLDASMRIVGMPWRPADDEDGLEEQRALLALAHEIEAAWFFQTGTRLPGGDEAIVVQELGEEPSEEDVSWSHGPPPQTTSVRFPV